MRKYLNFSNVVALIALFAVLGGGAYAASSLGKNSVGSKQLRKKAVKAKHIKDGAVTEQKIADEAITAKKLAGDALAAAKVAIAEHAQEAENAKEADAAKEAQHAKEADNAQTLNGFGLEQLRPAAYVTSVNPADEALDGTEKTLLEDTISVPAGGADVVVNGTLMIRNGAAVQGSLQCRAILGDGIEQIGQDVLASTPAVNPYISQVSILGMRSHLNVNEGEGGDVNISIRCIGSAGTLVFDRGDMVIEVFPDD